MSFENSFWLITSEWLKMDNFGSVGKYKFVKASYDEDNETENDGVIAEDDPFNLTVPFEV
eukprot:14419249-Ditylum_brightwellii.AAC.1